MPKRSKATSIFLDLYQLTLPRADLRSLGSVAERFAELPWENLTKFIKKHGSPAPITAAPERLREVPGAERLRLSEEVLADHARLGAGGTCFSLTNALRRIVTDLGYSAYPVMADMRHGANVHCALLVELDRGRFLLDPGYLVAEPIPLDSGGVVRIRQAGSELEYRPLAARDEFELHGRNDRQEVRFRYRLRARPIPEDAFVRFWLDSFDTPGMNGLHLNRIASEGRLSAHDLNLRIDTGRDKRNVKLRDGYVEKVVEHFRIDGDLARRAFACWEEQRCRRR